MSQTIFNHVKQPFFIRKEHLKFLSLIQTCFQTSKGLVVKKNIKAKKKPTFEMWSQIVVN